MCLSNFIFFTPKSTYLAEKTYNVESVGCVQRCDLWPWWRSKKGQKLSCVKLSSCRDHPRRRGPPKVWMRGRVRETVIYFKFHEGSRNCGWEVKNGHLPMTFPMAYTTALYYRLPYKQLQAYFRGNGSHTFFLNLFQLKFTCNFPENHYFGVF